MTLGDFMAYEQARQDFITSLRPEEVSPDG